MKSKAIVLALLAFAFQAQAVPVSQSQAATAVRAWARAGAALGARLGTSVADTETLVVTNGILVYAVHLAEGGVVFMSSDTSVEPIVAFTPSSDVRLSAGSPFVRLLQMDAVARRRLAEIGARSAQTSVSSSGAALAANARKWEALLAAAPSEGNSTPGAATSATSAKPLSSVNDVRVAPLLKSKWDQTTGGGGYCWNYYTPNHLPCGCTATASAQIMRYFKWPTVAMAQTTYDCMLEGESVKYTTKGGTYDWDSLPLVLTGSVSEEMRKALGKITYDVGVTLQTSYSAATGGSASPTRPAAMYRIFKYAGAYAYWDGTSYYTGKGGLHVLSLRQRIIYANLDARRPVQLAIYGYKKGHLYDENYWAGHSVVGDGYGFNTVGDVNTAYVHINMGWSGLDDMWYNIPEVDAANSGAHVGDSGYDFLYMGGATFNISPNESGKDILSGRVTDDDGTAVEGAQVTASLDGEPVQTVRSDANGIYAFTLAGGKDYEISAASADGKLVKELDAPVTLRKTTADSSHVVADSAKVGNSWGNDIMLAPAVVRIVVGTVTNTYSRLDKALADAKTIYAADPTKVVSVEVFDDAELRETVTVDFPCALTSTDPSTMSVTRTGDAQLQVLDGGELSVANIVFDGSDRMLVEVADGGRVTVGGGVDFGVPNTTPAVRVEKADGFLLTGAPAVWFAVDCVSARNIHEVFGYAAGDFAAVSGWAGKFVNLDDPNGELAGTAVDDGASPYALMWEMMPVPLAEATAYYVLDGTVETNCFRRLDRLFELFEEADAAGEIVVLQDATLSRSLTLKHDLRLVSSTEAQVTCSSSVGFTVGEGLSLMVSGVSFDGASGDSLFAVDGGTLVLAGAMEISNFKGTNALKSAAVRVTNGGTVRIGSAASDVIFSNCRNEFSQQATGGAICAAGAGTLVDLQGGVEIVGCHCRGTGGGIHVGKNAKLRLAGNLIIGGNTSGMDTNLLDSDVYCASSLATVEVAGLLAVGSAVGIRKVGSEWDKAGNAFATVTSDFTDKALIYDSSKAFFCDGNEALRAEPNMDYVAFAWTEDAGGVKPVDPSVAHAHAFRADGSEIGYFGSLEDAVTVLEGAAGKIELLRDTTLSTNVTVTSAVVLKSAAGGPFKLSRAAQCEVKVTADGSLSVADLTVSGTGALGRLFLIDGGELVLASGATVRDVTDGENRNDGAVKLSNGGRLVMQDGSRIVDCKNPFVSEYSGNARGGAVTADDDSRVRLEGGLVENCSANRGAGIFVGNRSVIEVGGTATVTNNADVAGRVANVYVPAYCELRLISPLTGGVGVTQGQTADPFVFGRVAEEYAGTDAELAESAHRFMNDLNGDLGFAVRNGDETLLVWSDGLNVEGNYVDADGKTYVPLAGGAVISAVLPTAAVGLTYNGGEQVGVEVGHGFVLTGNSGTHVGDYAATVTLKAGFAWDDGEAAKVRTVDWAIASAALMVTANAQTKAVGAADPVLTYAVSGLQGKDEATAVLTGELARVPGETAGTYAILQGTLSLTTADYALTYVGATLTILDQPGPTPTPVPCQPFAFTAIVEKADGSWLVTISPVVKYCTYTLLASDDLVTWTPVVKDFEATESGALEFNPAAGAGKKFWKAIGKDGVEPIDE